MLYNMLNNEQKAAVLSDHSRILCLAGAGSGKTKTLVTRVARLLEEGVEPSSILMLTFTRAAANEQKERVIAMAGELANEVVCGTFHSWAAKTLRMFAHRAGLTPSFTIYDEEDATSLVETIIDEMQYKVKPDKVMEAFEKRAVYNVPIKDETIKKVDNEYRFRLKRNNAIDLDGLIAVLINLLKSPEIAEAIRGLHRYVFVDEFQDTDHRQMRVLDLIEPENLFIVGDDFQSIYGFRGADVGIIMTLAKSNEWQTIKLERNYRSSENIVNAANKLIKHNNQTEKTLITDRKGPEITLIEAETPQHEREIVAMEIVQAGAENYQQTAILARTNKQLQDMTQELQQRGVPYEVKTRSSDALASFEAKKLFDWMAAILNPTNDQAVHSIINWPQPTINQMDMLRTEMYQIEQRSSLMSAIEVTDLAPEFKTYVLGIRGAIEQDYDPEEKVSANDLLEYIIETLNLADYYQNQGTINRLELINRIKARVLEWSVQMAEVGEDATAEAWLDYYKARMIEGDTIKEEKKDCISLMTAHGSKGLEFEKVFVIGCNEKSFPLSRGDIEEERRLFYVAITRAKEKLYLTRSKNKPLWDGGLPEPTQPSRFIDEAMA